MTFFPDLFSLLGRHMESGACVADYSNKVSDNKHLYQQIVLGENYR